MGTMNKKTKGEQRCAKFEKKEKRERTNKKIFFLKEMSCLRNI